MSCNCYYTITCFISMSFQHRFCAPPPLPCFLQSIFFNPSKEKDWDRNSETIDQKFFSWTWILVATRATLASSHCIFTSHQKLRYMVGSYTLRKKNNIYMYIYNKKCNFFWLIQLQKEFVKWWQIRSRSRPDLTPRQIWSVFFYIKTMLTMMNMA